MLNKAHGDSAYKVAKALVEGCEFNGSNPNRIEVKKLFIVSGGEAPRFENRNVKIESTDIDKEVSVRWLVDRVQSMFDRDYLPLVEELAILAKQKRISYGARIVFKNGNIPPSFDTDRIILETLQKRKC